MRIKFIDLIDIAFIALAGCTIPQHSDVSNRGLNDEENNNTPQYQRIDLDVGREFHVPDLPRLSAENTNNSTGNPNTNNQYDNPEEGIFPPEQYVPLDAGDAHSENDARTLDAFVDYNSIPPEEYFADAYNDVYSDAGFDGLDYNHLDGNDEELCTLYDTPGNNLDEDCDGTAVCPVPCVEDDDTRRQECGDGQGGWRNHGMYVSCVAHYANFLRQNGIITDEEANYMVNVTAHSDIGK